MSDCDGFSLLNIGKKQMPPVNSNNVNYTVAGKPGSKLILPTKTHTIQRCWAGTKCRKTYREMHFKDDEYSHVNTPSVELY